MKKYVIILLLIFFYLWAAGQGKIGNFNTIFKDNFAVGVKLKNNGYGVLYRHGTFINIYSRKFYEIELDKITDPKEIKFSNPFLVSLNKVYYGKLYDCIEFRYGRGMLNIMTWKQDVGSVEIRYFNVYGGSLLLLKPVYYYVIDKTGTYAYYTKFKQDLLLQQILEMAPYYMGLNEVKFNFGAYTKLGISFEYSKHKNGISAVELGVSGSVFLFPIQLMYGSDRRRFIVNFFVSYNLGQYYMPHVSKKTKKKQ